MLGDMYLQRRQQGQNQDDTQESSRGDTLKAKGRQRIPAGERLVMAMPGGGGYGAVAQRDRDAVLADVRNGLVSREAAIKDYGVTPPD
jgi:N-methylhydantoinase B